LRPNAGQQPEEEHKMIQVRQLSRTTGVQALVLAVMAAALLAIAGLGGYEIGSRATQSQAAPAPPAAAQIGGGQEAAPDFGPQP
jgi:hypothetical protein